MDKFPTFYDDALAYLTESINAKRSPDEILNTLLHDIGGVARQERCFMPRVSGWAKAKQKFLRKGEKP